MIVKKYGIDFYSEGGALTLNPEEVALKKDIKIFTKNIHHAHGIIMIYKYPFMFI